MQIISNKKQLRYFLMLLIFVAMRPLNAAKVSVHENDETGLITWAAEGEGFSLELIQLIPDFVRAVYAKHNFPAEEVERIASFCVFGTILKNTSKQVMHYRVANWRYRTHDGVEHPVKTKTQWLKEWNALGIKFSWTLLPDRGDFEVGDWQQGFTTMELTDTMTREVSFDFIYSWKLGEKSFTGTIKDLSCAPKVL